MNEDLTSQVTNGIQVAKGISDYGMTTISASFFIIVSIVIFTSLMILMTWMIKKIITKMLKDFDRVPSVLALIKDNLGETKLIYENILDVSKTNLKYLSNLQESMVSEHLATLNLIVSENFKLSQKTIIEIIQRTINENHIHGNEEIVKSKIMGILKNLYNERKSYFSHFSYNNHDLSYYLDDEYIQKIHDVVISEIYSNNKESLMRTNISIVYDEMKNDFLKRMQE